MIPAYWVHRGHHRPGFPDLGKKGKIFYYGRLSAVPCGGCGSSEAFGVLISCLLSLEAFPDFPGCNSPQKAQGHQASKRSVPGAITVAVSIQTSGRDPAQRSQQVTDNFGFHSEGVGSSVRWKVVQGTWSCEDTSCGASRSPGTLSWEGYSYPYGQYNCLGSTTSSFLNLEMMLILQ